MCDCWKDEYEGPIPCGMCRIMDGRKVASAQVIIFTQGGDMTSEKLISVLANYRDELMAMGVVAQQLPEEAYCDVASSIGQAAILSHQLYLCIQGIEHAREGSIEKAMRWLGHVQGVLWAHDIYCLDDVKKHSRPDM